jgi:hypothetical protein
MQVMRAEATTLFKPKGFSKAKDVDAHQETEVEDEVSDEAHRSTWGGVSLISPHPKDKQFHLLHMEAGFPKDLEVNKVAQQGPQHSYHQHLLPKVEQTEDSKVHRSIAAQPASRDRIKSTNNLFRM